jgi:hypothetical protein
MGKKKSKASGGLDIPASVATKAVSEADIVKACWAGNLVKLRRLKRQEVRVVTAESLIVAAHGGFLALVLCLIQEFGVDVDHMSC